MVLFCFIRERERERERERKKGENKEGKRGKEKKRGRDDGDERLQKIHFSVLLLDVKRQQEHPLWDRRCLF